MSLKHGRAGDPKKIGSSRRKLDPTERFLRALAPAGTAVPAETGSCYRAGGTRITLAAAQVDDLLRRDLLQKQRDGTMALTDAGRSHVARLAVTTDPHRAQHGQVEQADSIAPGARIEMAESPLLWLHRRKDSNGELLIGAAQFAAGERLRSDFTLGNLMPRVTANWEAIGGSAHGASGGAAGPSDGALAARQRVRKAVEWMGPELAGVVLDVCCFLKRLEDVERERRWPARSAKIILSLGLGRLARLYGYSDFAEGGTRRKAS
jgi:hypothetical protein